MSNIPTDLAQARRRRLQELDDYVLTEGSESDGTKFPSITSSAAVAAPSSAVLYHAPAQVTNARLDEASRTFRLQLGGLKLGSSVEKLLKPTLALSLIHI